MSTINFDLSEPDVANMVNQWKAGGKYRVELNITLDSNDGKAASATVDSVTDYGDASESDVTEDQGSEATAATSTPEGDMGDMGAMMGGGEASGPAPKAVMIAMMGKKKK